MSRNIALTDLDKCLDLLEEANLIGIPIVSDKMAATLCEYVPAITPGVSIEAALDEVFYTQNRFLSRETTQPKRSRTRPRLIESVFADPNIFWASWEKRPNRFSPRTQQ